MLAAIFVTLAFAVTNALRATQIHNHLSDEFIAELNMKAITWKAGGNFARDTPIEYLNSLGCAILSDSSVTVKTNSSNSREMPHWFDARKKWKHCLSLREIRDQGRCGDCWAVASAETITDRECIHNGRKFHASSVDIVSCCQKCHFINGCRSGYPDRAFEYYVDSGVVSGGSFGSNSGCKPYPKEEHDYAKVPTCVRKCTTSSQIKYQNDLHHGSNAYSVAGEKQMMAEIYNNGPIVVVFELFEDLYSYKSGVYKMTKGSSQGFHAVKVLGWGIEKKTPYWLIANSWSADWGDHGYVKFWRGSNHCGIEENVHTVLPKAAISFPEFNLEMQDN